MRFGKKKTADGNGTLRFEKVAGKSVVTESFAKSPLKILTPKNMGHASWAYSSNFGGGYVGGDAIEIEIQVMPGAQAVLLSQASTKVYRSDKTCTQTIKAEIADDAFFCSIPDAVVCFAGAKFHQVQKYDMHENSSLIVADILHCGREHSGERWAFDTFKNEVHVTRNDKRIFFESLLLNTTAGNLARRHSRFNALSMVLIIGPAFIKHADEIMESLNSSAVVSKQDFVISGSRLGADGVVIRMGAVSTEIMAEAIKETLNFLPQYLGDDPWARKW